MTRVDRNGEAMDADVVIWAKERENYVTPLKIVSFQIKSPSKFGWKTAPFYGAEEEPEGKLCLLPWSVIQKHRPTMLEVADSGCPISEFLFKLDSEKFFDNIRWLRVYESNAEIDQLCHVIENCPVLSVVELYESRFGTDDRQRLLNALATRRELKGFDFVYSFTGSELNEWFKILRMKLRIVRFSGPPAVKVSDIKIVNVDMPLVEFLAVQDLDVDVSTEGANKKWHRDLLNRFCHMFPCVKYVFLDYKVFDTVFIYDDDTVPIFEALRDFFVRMKLVCFAILIYCPDEEMKVSVAKAAKFLADDCEIRTEVKYLFCGSADVKNATPNFALLVLGDQVHRRTERLVETIVAERNTRPDLRHFCSIIDQDAFLRPNSTIAFGGMDKESVKNTYEEKHASKLEPVFVPDTVMQRYVHG